MALRVLVFSALAQWLEADEKKSMTVFFSWIFHWETLQPVPKSRDIAVNHWTCPASGIPMPQDQDGPDICPRMT